MPSRSANRRVGSVRRSFALVVRRALVLLVALLVSNLPLPFVHQHELNGERVVHCSGLSKHVDHFHAQAARAGERQTGWHLHLIMPWQNTEDPDADPVQTPEPITTAALGSPAMAAGIAHDGLGFDLSLDQTLVAAGEFLTGNVRTSTANGPSQLSPRQFFSSYGTSVTLGDLIGVRLC